MRAGSPCSRCCRGHYRDGRSGDRLVRAGRFKIWYFDQSARPGTRWYGGALARSEITSVHAQMRVAPKRIFWSALIDDVRRIFELPASRLFCGSRHQPCTDWTLYGLMTQPKSHRCPNVRRHDGFVVEDVREFFGISDLGLGRGCLCVAGERFLCRRC